MYPTKKSTTQSLRRFLRSAVLAVMLLGSSTYAVYAAPATVSEVKSETVTLIVDNQPLKTVLSQIEAQTGYLFVVNDNVDTNIRVSVKANGESVKSVLNKVLAGRNINVAYQGTSILLSSKKGEAAKSNTPINKVTGTVYDEMGEPAIGASVRVKGANQGVATDADGNFTLQGNFTSGTELEISYVGLKNALVKVGNGQDLQVHMESDYNMLQEVVAVGYGTQKRANLTGAVATVDVEKQLDSRPITSVSAGLQGSVPGLNITSATGKPGDSATMKIRGVLGSINGDTSPLIIVDGVEVNNLDVINPADIESISVLKDAASTSIYGVRASYGVVLIKTKQAQLGEKFTVNYSNNFAWKAPTVIPELAVGSESATLALLGAERSKNVSSLTNDINMYWDWDTIERMKEWERVYGDANLSPELVEGRDYEVINGRLNFYRSWDPYSTMMKKNSFQQNHNFGISGSSGKTAYNVGLGFMGTDGLAKVNNDTQRRYNITFGTQTQLRDWFQFHTKLMYTRTETENPYDLSTSQDAWYYLFRWPATYPYGTLNGEPIRSAYAERQQANRNKITNNWMRVNLGTVIDLYKGLSFEADYTFTHVGRYTQTNGGEASGYDFWGGSFNYTTWTNASDLKATRSSAFSDWHSVNALFRYNYDNEIYGNVAAFVGTNIESYHSYGADASRTGLLLVDRPELSLATGDATVSSNDTQWATTGFFGRVNYDWKGRYLVEANLRYDGSSRFPSSQRWGLFPSFSGGWNITQENFMEPLMPKVTLAKVRASWGQVGSLPSSLYMFAPIMTESAYSWIVDGDYSYSLSMPKAIADGFGWETVTTTDIGLDLRFFNNDLGFSFDWFSRRTSDLITDGPSMPFTFGQDAPKQNYGHLTTTGWELAVDYHHTFPFGLGMTITANISDATGKYNNVNPTEQRVNQIYNGKTYGEIWGFKTEGLFQAEDFTYDEAGNITGYAPGVADQTPVSKPYGNNFEFGPGDVRYKDLDGDGYISTYTDANGDPVYDTASATLDNHGDYTVIGNTTPRYQYGIRLDLSYKGFDASIFFQGVGKRNLWGTGQLVIPGWHFGEAYYSHQMDYWTPENTDAFYPRPYALNYASANPNFRTSDRYLLNMAYCRLKNLTIGYTLPENITRSIYLSKVRLYCSLENLATWDNLNGVPIDPESTTPSTAYGYIGRSYPFSKEYSFGLQVTF